MALTARGDHGKRAPESAFANSEANLVVNKDLGTKQLCPSCEVKFYDLNKRPAVCPKCTFSFDPEDDAVKAKVKSTATKSPKKKSPVPEDEEDTGTDTEATGDDEDEEADPEAAKELGGDVEEVVLEGADSTSDDDDVMPGGVPAGFSEEGVDDDEVIADDDDTVTLPDDDDADLVVDGNEDEVS